MCPRRVDAWWQWRDEHVLVTLRSTGSSFALNQIAGAVFESCDGQRSTRDVELEAERLVGRPLGEGIVTRALAELARAGLVVVDGHREASPSSSALTAADILGVPVVEPVPEAAFLPPGHARGAHTPRALGVTRCGVRIVVVNEDGVDLRDMLPDGASLHPDEEIAPDVRYVIRTPADLSPWPEVERTRGEECLRVVGMVGRAELMGWLSRDLDESVALCSRAGVVARAGAVTWRGHAVLVTDQGGPGPSPLVAELVRLGATHHAERVALLDDEGRVHPSGGASASTTPLRPTLIVAMRYDRGASWSPQVVRGAEAVLPVLGCAPGARRDPRRGVQLVARLAAGVTTLAGAMPAAAVAAPHVLRILDDIIDGRPPVIPSPVRATPAANPLGPEDRPEGFTAARYVAVDDFLEPNDHARVLAFACGQEASFETSQVMARASSKVDTEVRKSRTLFSGSSTR